MSSERKVINALLKIHEEYIQLFERLGDKRYLQRANNCIEVIRQHFLSEEMRTARRIASPTAPLNLSSHAKTDSAENR